MTLTDALREEGRGMRRMKPTAEEPEETEEHVAAPQAAITTRFAQTLARLSLDGDGAARVQDEATQQQAVRSLSVADSDVAKVVPERIFSLAFHPSAQKLLVAAGDKWGN